MNRVRVSTLIVDASQPIPCAKHVAIVPFPTNQPTSFAAIRREYVPSIGAKLVFIMISLVLLAPSGSAIQQIVAGPAVQVVISRSADQDIVSLQSEDVIIAPKGIDLIVAGSSGDIVSVFRRDCGYSGCESPGIPYRAVFESHLLDLGGLPLPPTRQTKFVARRTVKGQEQVRLVPGDDYVLRRYPRPHLDRIHIAGSLVVINNVVFARAVSEQVRIVPGGVVVVPPPFIIYEKIPAPVSRTSVEDIVP